MKILSISPVLLLSLLASRCNQPVDKSAVSSTTTHYTMDTSKDHIVNKTDSEWRAQLTPEEYRVLRQKGTERPYSSEFETFWDSGTYVCKACGNELFHSNTKFDAQCGWPSFYKTIDKSAVREIRDTSHGMIRTEVVCARCGSHLGHVFDDAKMMGQPEETRYCINGVSLGFKKK